MRPRLARTEGRQARGTRTGSHRAAKLRGAAVMYGPSLMLDLFEGASVLATATGVLSRRQGGKAGRALRALAAAGALSPWAHLLAVRPWLINWGATDEEVRRGLPGDGLVPHPTLLSTRAVTVRAPAREVWPWLVQLGQDRGGFYSYDRLENLAGAGIHNAEEIVPGMQHLEVGDFVPMAPVEWGVPMGGFTVAGIEPGRAIVWRQGWPEEVAGLEPPEALSRGTWAFVLEEVDDRTTRLILRERSGLGPGIRDAVLHYLLMERQHFVMVRRMLLGIKERAERAQGGGTLLDGVMPAYEFSGRAVVRIAAPPARTMRAFEELTLAEATPAPVRALISLRYLPGRLAGRGRSGEVHDGGQTFRGAMLGDGNTILAEEPGREVVVGTVGKFHNMLDQQPAPIRDAEEFDRFDDPAYQKLAMSWHADADGKGGCELVMEHRTHALGAASRRAFALYWWLMIKAGSAVMARMLLRAVKRRAEGGE